MSIIINQKKNNFTSQTRLELATFRLEDERSIQLSYWDTYIYNIYFFNLKLNFISELLYLSIYYN